MMDDEIDTISAFTRRELKQYYTYKEKKEINQKEYNDNYANTSNDSISEIKIDNNVSNENSLNNNEENKEITKFNEKIKDLEKNVKKNKDNFFIYFIKRINEKEFKEEINYLLKNSEKYIENKLIDKKDKKDKYEIGIGKLWQLINNIYMIKIFIDLKNNEKIDESSFIYENNENYYLYNSLLNKIINDFEFEYFSELYDYIYFEDSFIIKKNKCIGIYEKYKQKYGGLDSNNNDSYSYIFLNKYENNLNLEDNIINKWNKYIQNENIKEKKLNIIYSLFDIFDLKDNRCRIKFYKKIFENIGKEENKNIYLKDTKFFNAIIFLILNDNKNIFKILSLDDQINNNKELQKIIFKMIKTISIKIESLFNYFTNKQTEEGKKKTLDQAQIENIEELGNSEEILNSLILFLKLIGKYNNIPFHKIICTNINYLDDEKDEFIVIKKLFNLYIDAYKSLDEKNKNLIIVFHSLTQCIIEYTYTNLKIKKELKNILIENVDELHKLNDELFKKIKEDPLNKDENENENILLFIIKNSLLFKLHCLKYLEFEKSEKLKIFRDEDLRNINLYFRKFLSLNKEINKEKLFESYKDNKFKNKLILFTLILLYYKIIFYLRAIPDYEIYGQCFFDIHNNNSTVEKYIQLHFNDDKSMSLLLPLFTFLQEIRDIIEIQINKEKIYLINILIPEIFNLKKYSKNFLNSIFDYSNRENKFLNIYNYIECLIYDIKTKKNYFYENLLNWKIEFINYFIVLVENISLIIFYSKSTKGSIEKYNEIAKVQNSIIFSILIIIHCLFLLFIIILWCIFRRKIDYFNSLTKYFNSNSEIYDKLNLEKKIKLIKNNSDFDEFFPIESDIKYKKINYFKKNCIEEFIEKIILCLKNIKRFEKYLYSLRNIFPFIFTLICLIGYLLKIQIFLVFPLILMFNSSETLYAIIIIIYHQFKTLFLLLVYMFVILYIFSLLGFFYLPNMFKYESVNNNNDLIYTEENICSSAISCILYFFNFGITSEGYINMNLISFKNNTGYYIAQFFFTIILYLIIHMIFFNVILASITNSFDKMRELINEKENNIKNVCFICQKKRNDCINESEDFNYHLFKHNKWKYIIFMCSILLKDKEELSQEETIIYEQIIKGKIDWFPEYVPKYIKDFQEKYKLPSLTVDVIALREGRDKKSKQILLTIRTKTPYKGKYALPGGFVTYNETPENACIRILKRYIELNSYKFEVLTIKGDPNRDPRRHVITIVYIVNVDANAEIKKLDEEDYENPEFLELIKINTNHKEDLAFDHYDIIEELKNKTKKNRY